MSHSHHHNHHSKCCSNSQSTHQHAHNNGPDPHHHHHHPHPNGGNYWVYVLIFFGIFILSSFLMFIPEFLAEKTSKLNKNSKKSKTTKKEKDVEHSDCCCVDGSSEGKKSKRKNFSILKLIGEILGSLSVGMLLGILLTHLIPELIESEHGGCHHDHSALTVEISHFSIGCMIGGILYVILLLVDGYYCHSMIGGHGHSHDHEENACENQKSAIFQSCMYLGLLSIHSILEGRLFCNLKTAVPCGIHRLIESISVGSTIHRIKGMTFGLFLTQIFAFSFVTNILILIYPLVGNWVSEGHAFMVVLNAISVGAILYVVCTESVPEQISDSSKKQTPPYFRISCLSFGFILSSMISILLPHSH